MPEVYACATDVRKRSTPPSSRPSEGTTTGSSGVSVQSLTVSSMLAMSAGWGLHSTNARKPLPHAVRTALSNSTV